MKSGAIGIVILLILVPLSGCFGAEEEIEVLDDSPFALIGDIANTTWYHYSGGIDALDSDAVELANITENLTGNNAPYSALGSYYGIGMSTFEPTIGITSLDNIYMSSWGNGPA